MTYLTSLQGDTSRCAKPSAAVEVHKESKKAAPKAAVVSKVAKKGKKLVSIMPFPILKAMCCVPDTHGVMSMFVLECCDGVPVVNNVPVAHSC